MKYSNSYSAKKKRIKNLPAIFDVVMIGAIRRDSLNLIEEFQKGIEDNNFGLEPLQSRTIETKQRQGMPKPENPLLGKGDREKDRSYKNMLRMRRIKNGWKIYPSWAAHWSGKIKLRDLFEIHEKGCKIVKGETVIQIPPRPAFLMAYRRIMSKKYRQETSKEVKKAIFQYVEKGSMAGIEKIKGKKSQYEE